MAMSLQKKFVQTINLKIIAITASAIKEDQEVISEICDYYLPKPVLSAHLFRALINLQLPHTVKKLAELDSNEHDLSVNEIKLLKEELSSLTLQALIDEALESLSINKLYKLQDELRKIKEKYPEAEFLEWLKSLQEAVDTFNMADVEKVLKAFKTLRVFSVE